MLKKSTVTSNMILYCRKWKQTSGFYRNFLELPVNFHCDWFIHFPLMETSKLKVADENKCTIKSPDKKGITIALQVPDIDTVWQTVSQKSLNPTEIKPHPWNAYVFHFFDPEGHRIEIWQSLP